MACVSLWGRVGRLAPSVTQRMGWKRADQVGCSCHTKDGRGWFKLAAPDTTHGRGQFKLAAPDTQRKEGGRSCWLLLTHKGRKRAGHTGCFSAVLSLCLLRSITWVISRGRWEVRDHRKVSANVTGFCGVWCPISDLPLHPVLCATLGEVLSCMLCATVASLLLHAVYNSGQKSSPCMLCATLGEVLGEVLTCMLCVTLGEVLGEVLTCMLCATLGEVLTCMLCVTVAKVFSCVLCATVGKVFSLCAVYDS